MISFKDWRETLRALPYGKRLPEAVYIVRPKRLDPNEVLHREIRRASLAAKPPRGWNLLKLHTKEHAVTFLEYPNFNEDPHPSLSKATKINLSTGRIVRTDFSARANPPILHRKECFLPLDDFRREIFAKLTKAEEVAGLFRDPYKIGNRIGWESLLRKKKLRFEGHELVADKKLTASVPSTTVEVARHRTAIKRYDLSKPVKILIKHGILRKGRSFFDYGCGHGMDVEGLVSLGYEASGWDPAFRPKAKCEMADVVNLGYVLNVIEEHAEREEALHTAWCLAHQVLILSVLSAGQETTAHQRVYRDGFLTRSGTFQKFYEPGELEVFIERHLKVEAVTVAPGVCLVFRDPIERESFVASRARRQIDWTEISSQIDFSQPCARKRSTAGRYALHKELFDSFWNTLLTIGRLPVAEEFDRIAELRSAAGSIRKAFDLVLEQNISDRFEKARKIHREDLLVYLAMTRFRPHFRRKDLSLRIKRDIKAFFGDFDLAYGEANDLLFASGDPGELELALETIDFGFYDAGEGHFTFHRKRLNQLPPVLRIYVLCGAWVYGDLDGIDLIKIHLYSGKLTLLIFEEFERVEQPVLQERIKIQLRTQWVGVFDHRSDCQCLKNKNLFL